MEYLFLNSKWPMVIIAASCGLSIHREWLMKLFTDSQHNNKDTKLPLISNLFKLLSHIVVIWFFLFFIVTLIYTIFLFFEFGDQKDEVLYLGTIVIILWILPILLFFRNLFFFVKDFKVQEGSSFSDVFKALYKVAFWPVILFAVVFLFNIILLPILTHYDGILDFVSKTV